MGCCFSSPTTQIHNKNQNNKSTQKNNHHEPPPPPPPPLEEESVKEVLSETPISKPQQVPILRPETKTLLPLHENPPPNIETKPKDNPVEEVSETVSQLSETCSVSMTMSESFSAATTTTVTEKREEDEATSKIHKWDQSPSRKRPYPAEGNLAAGRERRVKSQARKPEPPSENKIKGGPRPIRGRESVPAANRMRNASPATLRRDSGDCSGRRSRSPACGRIGKSGTSIGRKEVTPAKVVVNEVEKEKKSESEEVIKSESERERKDVVSQQEECLQNPHVSMECFIFL